MVYNPFPILLACCHATARSNETFFFSVVRRRKFEICLAFCQKTCKYLSLRPYPVLGTSLFRFSRLCPRCAIQWPAQNFVQGCAGWLLIRCFSGIPERPCPCGQTCAHGPCAIRLLENLVSSGSEHARGIATPPKHACHTRPFARTLNG